MILQLQNFPVIVNIIEKGADCSEEYRHVIREIRWILLNESDWIMAVDSPVSDSVRQEWITWRQMLRDLTDSLPDDLGVTYEIPSPPEQYCPKTWVNVTPDAGWVQGHAH